MKRQLFSVCFALLLSDCVFGQGVGTIHGTVTDASGKAVPRAKVNAILEVRGTTRTIVPTGAWIVDLGAGGLRRCPVTGQGS